MQLFDMNIMRAFGYRVEGRATLLVIDQLDSLEDGGSKQIAEIQTCGIPVDEIKGDSDRLVLISCIGVAMLVSDQLLNDLQMELN